MRDILMRPVGGVGVPCQSARMDVLDAIATPGAVCPRDTDQAISFACARCGAFCCERCRTQGAPGYCPNCIERGANVEVTFDGVLREAFGALFRAPGDFLRMALLQAIPFGAM